MTPQLRSPLPLADRCALVLLQALVPKPDRADWLRTWQAELWFLRYGRAARLQTFRSSADLVLGLTIDALWLRTEGCRRALAGTSTLCLAVLLGCCALSTLAAWALDGSWPVALTHLGREAVRCLFAAPLVVFVTSLTASSRHIGASSSKPYRRTRQLFFLAKTTLALLLTYLLSADLCRPLSTAFPAAGVLLQTLCFVIFSIFALAGRSKIRKAAAGNVSAPWPRPPVWAALRTICWSGTARPRSAGWATACSASPRWKPAGAGTANGLTSTTALAFYRSDTSRMPASRNRSET